MKKRTTHPHRKLQKGMTLIEVLVAISIIAILAALVAVAVIPQLDDAKTDAAKIDISNIMGALKIYYAKKGNYPSTAGGLQELVSARVLEKLPQDPWGRPYIYTNEGGKPVVLSYGKDGSPGGTGNDEDISSQNL
jgi:general secretion pathway protein G